MPQLELGFERTMSLHKLVINGLVEFCHYIFSSNLKKLTVRTERNDNEINKNNILYARNNARW